MEKENKKESGSDHAAQPEAKGLTDRLRGWLRLRIMPDTTEELESEIRELLEEGEEQGLISRQEERLINSIFNFRETRSREIMTPSAEMVMAEQNTSLTDLVKLISREGFTRIPIFAGNPDTIVGILHAKDLLCVCLDGDHQDEVMSRLHPPLFIREETPIIDLLHRFQEKKQHMAIVTDEFGGVRGLVTLEDVIEEIVGEIVDEHDQEDMELRVMGENVVLVDAKIDIEKVEDFFDCQIPEGPYESVGGLITHRLGKIPQRGCRLEVGGLLFTVLAADQRRVRTVRIEPLR